MIFVTGDTHGDFSRFTKERFEEQAKMTKDDYVIICGDFGSVWNGSAAESKMLDWLEDLPFSVLWVDGNHENYDMLKKIPIEEWHGGKVQRVRPHVLHLMRGQLFEIEGLTFFTMGGAASHDIQDGILDPRDPFYEEDYACMSRSNLMFRVLGISWWPEELPDDQEYREAWETLEKVGWEVDYVISHCAPSGIVKLLGSFLETNKLTDFFDEISKKLSFQYWLFGHYHENCSIGQNYVLLYQEILRLE